MKIVLFFLKHSRKLLIFSMIVGALSGACNAALLALVNSSLKSAHPGVPLIWAFTGMCVMLPLTRYVSQRLLIDLGQRATFDLRMKLCRQMLSAPLRHLEGLGAPKLLTALTDDVPSITNAVTIIPVLCVDAALVIGSLIYMGMLSGTLLAIVLIFMALGIVTYQTPILRVEKIFRLARGDVDKQQANFRGLTQGIKELKIHASRQSAFLRDGLEATAKSLLKYNTRALNLYTLASVWGQVLVFIVIGLIIFLLPLMRQLTVPTLMGYTLALLYLMTPLEVIMNSLPQLTRANVALSTARGLEFELAAEESEPPAALPEPKAQWRDLHFEDLTHLYPGESEARDFVVGPLNVTFRAREIVFIVGGNGSGKTTFVKLLTGLYLPRSGAIRVGDEIIDKANVEGYRQYFSVVFSDFYLFETMFGLIGPELDDRATQYLEELKLSHKVTITGGKLSTTDLSQGQRKRLALLTMLLEDRPVYVFDEWAADQDPYFKDIFYRQILPDLRARGKTVFVITHDDRYYPVADRLIKLEEGRIVSDVSATPAGGVPAARTT